MLVIVSDLHLTDGTTTSTTPPGAFEIFAQRLCDMAQRASWRADGRYRPIERLDLVLLGDVLDITSSRRWLAGDVRPWDHTDNPQVIDTVSKIVDDILIQNGPALGILRSLAAEGTVGVMPASQSGEPIYSAGAASVPVRTHYMVGNHDWPLHLTGASYDMIRQKVAHHLGLANPHHAPFPHDPQECGELLETMRNHRVLARHGDIYDPLNFSEDRDSSSLGDAITIELAARFITEIETQLGNELPPAVTTGLRQLYHVRPLLMIPAWIDGLLQRACPQPALRKYVKRIWDRLADEFLELDIVRRRDTWSPFELLDGLAAALKFSKRQGIGWSTKIVTWLNGLRGAASDSYYQHALTEADFRNRRARHIVYGHTHHAESVPLDASYADSFVLNQMYFNAGTWQRVYRPAQFSPGQHEFIPADCMSFLSFYQGDERGGRPFETWSGSLGVGAESTFSQQSDPQQIERPAVAAPHAAIGPPHFVPGAAVPQVRSVPRL